MEEATPESIFVSSISLGLTCAESSRTGQTRKKEDRTARLGSIMLYESGPHHVAAHTSIIHGNYWLLAITVNAIARPRQLDEHGGCHQCNSCQIKPMRWTSKRILLSQKAIKGYRVQFGGWGLLNHGLASIHDLFGSYNVGNVWEVH